MACNPIDGQLKKGTSNFKLREYNLVPDQKARVMKIDFQVMQPISKIVLRIIFDIIKII